MDTTSTTSTTSTTFLTTPSKNRGFALYSEAIDLIALNPEAHNQEVWGAATGVLPNQYEPTDEVIFGEDIYKISASCDTAMCVAGHTAVLGGGELLWQHEYTDYDYDYDYDGMRHFTATYVRLPNGRLKFVADYAAELLDIPPNFVSALFAATNTFGDLLKVRQMWAHGASYEDMSEELHIRALQRDDAEFGTDDADGDNVRDYDNYVGDWDDYLT